MCADGARRYQELPLRLILIRHGESEGNANGVIQGHLDFGLSALGQRQAEATAARLRDEGVERILTSPLKRATDTARVIAETTGLVTTPEPALMEYDVGSISGMKPAEIRERYPEISAAYARGERPAFPGEEGRDVFYKRLNGLLDFVRERDETVVAVAHGGVVSAFCYIVLGMDLARRGKFQLANCSITEIAKDRAGRLVVRRQNDVCHLATVTAFDAG